MTLYDQIKGEKCKTTFEEERQMGLSQEQGGTTRREVIDVLDNLNFLSYDPEIVKKAYLRVKQDANEEKERYSFLKRIFSAEKDCKNKKRFGEVLLKKLLAKKEQRREMQDFISSIQNNIEDREKMRIFIAYYFDAQRYQQYPERSMREAYVMIKRSDFKAGPIDQNNFYESSYAYFHRKKKSDLPQREADYVSYAYEKVRDEERKECARKQSNRISSLYRYTQEGVYRMSDHRGAKIRRCSWVLSGNQDKPKIENVKKVMVGFCPRKDFLHKQRFFLSDHLYWETGDERSLPTIPLELLGKEVGIFEFNRKGQCKIIDLGSPIDNHPRHYADSITILINQNED